MNFDEFTIPKNATATPVSIICEKFEGHCNEQETTRSLDELVKLLGTLKVIANSSHIQRRKKVDPATIIGLGRLQEIAEIAKKEGSEFLIFDCELTATQVRNIRKITKMDVIDRCSIILEIFAQHAQSKSAKIQVEISRLKYLLPRLTALWSHLGRQKGGIGVRGGEGEQQIELDRRIIRKRIDTLKKEVKHVVVSRNEQKKRRKNRAIITSIIGYTNAGKSSLLNRLCNEQILEEDMLFATLDSTYRALNPNSKPPMILVDTVGFISNLPAELVEGFKTTLESAIEAELLLIVCDLSDPYYEKHIEVTNKILKDLGADHKEKLIVFNKIDQVTDPHLPAIAKKLYPNSFFVSTFKDKDMSDLRNHIVQYFLDKQPNYDVFIPYNDGLTRSKVLGSTNIISSKDHKLGTFFKIAIPEATFNSLNINDFLLSPAKKKRLLQDNL